MDAESTTQQLLESPAEDEFKVVPVKVNIRPPKFETQQETTPDPKTGNPAEPSDPDLVYLAYAMIAGEVPVGMIQVDYQIKRLDDGTKSLTDLPFVRSTTRSVLVKEGQGLWTFLRFWNIISMMTLSLAYLSWAITAITLTRDSGWRNVSETKSGVSILISLVAVFSLASLVQKLGSFGWRRSLRQLWVWLSPSPFKKLWRGADHTRGVFGTQNRAPSSAKWLGVTVMCIAWTGLSLMLPFLLG
jgi:hypothetical protein